VTYLLIVVCRQLAVSCLMQCNERREILAEVIATTRRWFADRDALNP
jgi:hypothetical protein